MTLTRLVTVLKTPLCIMLLTVVYYEMGVHMHPPPYRPDSQVTSLLVQEVSWHCIQIIFTLKGRIWYFWNCICHLHRRAGPESEVGARGQGLSIHWVQGRGLPRFVQGAHAQTMHMAKIMTNPLCIHAPDICKNSRKYGIHMYSSSDSCSRITELEARSWRSR